MRPSGLDELIEFGADTCAENDGGVQPLQIAARKKFAEVIAALLDAGSDPTVRDGAGESRLTATITMDSPYCSCKLTRVRAGNTPLHIVVANRDTKNIKKMLKLGGDTEVENKEGDTPLLVALKNSDQVRDPTTWTILRHDGPNHLGLWCNALPGQQNSPNHLGLCARQTAVNEILEAHCNCMHTNKAGDSPLHVAINTKHAGEISLLLRAGAGESRLTATITMDSPYCSCKLTRVRADPTMRNAQVRALSMQHIWSIVHHDGP